MSTNIERRLEKLEQAGEGISRGGLNILIGTDLAELQARAAALPRGREALNILVIRSSPTEDDAPPA